MLRLSRWVGAVAVLMSASVAFAQRPGGGQGGFGGFGGFGGGFGGAMNSPLTLAVHEAVQKELNLSDEQVGDIKSLGEKAREESRSASGDRPDIQALQQLPEDERRKKFTEFQEKSAAAAKKVQEKFQPKLNEILTAEQSERLKQIRLQNSGAQVYQDVDVVAALKLSKEQQEKLAAISKEFDAKRAELFQGLGFGGGAAGGERPNREEMQKRMEENQKKMTEMNAARDKQLAEVLTEDQKAELEKLKGKTFDVAQLRPRFGGPGGPGGGGGGGGANPAGRPRRQPAAGDKKSDN